MEDRIKSQTKIKGTNKLSFSITWARLKTMDTRSIFQFDDSNRTTPTHVTPRRDVQRSITLGNENIIWIQIRKFLFFFLKSIVIWSNFLLTAFLCFCGNGECVYVKGRFERTMSHWHIVEKICEWDLFSEHTRRPKRALTSFSPPQPSPQPKNIQTLKTGNIFFQLDITADLIFLENLQLDTFIHYFHFSDVFPALYHHPLRPPPRENQQLLLMTWTQWVLTLREKYKSAPVSLNQVLKRDE